MTRTGAEDHHSKHLPFNNGTKATLRIDGTWKGHSPENISQTTTATIGAETASDSKHNSLTMSPQLYWDDYGTADPANMPDVAGNGRDKGLTIYGAAVDGVTTAPTVSDWTALSWTVSQDQSASGVWGTQDLLISNNVKEGTGDGTYKFDNRSSGKLLEFTHALSKITVKLIAGDGFPTTGVGATATKFATAPEVKLTGDEGDATTNAWANTNCSVNVETGVVSSASTPAIITMHEADRTNSSYTVIYDALVAPGSVFGASSGEPATFPVIARINADGNIYYVTSEKIRAAITTKYGSGQELEFKTQSGLNYIITVTVKKTKIEVTATIKDWEDITAETVYPVINVDASYGGSGTALDKEAFSFYRSTSLNTGYSSGIATVNDYYPSEAVVKKPTSPETKWTFTDGSENPKPLFWTDHSTHYQMRGVWPQTVTTSGDAVTSPRVETTTHESVEYQVIKVKNVAYETGTFPSDLAIARPNVNQDATCHNSDHTAVNLYAGGICATEGTVNLDFEYMMSQVEVNLSTTDGNDQVSLTNAKVEVTNLYTAGDIKLGDRGAIVTGEKALYTLHSTSTAKQFKDAIVPQELTYSTEAAQKENNVRFKITIYKNGDSEQGIDDIYYADIAPIKKHNEDALVAPNGKWENGKHYVYNLKLSKTKIDVTATFKDWITVTADEPIWF